MSIVDPKIVINLKVLEHNEKKFEEAFNEFLLLNQDVAELPEEERDYEFLEKVTEEYNRLEAALNKMKKKVELLRSTLLN
jgi:hypothetical protein